MTRGRFDIIGSAKENAGKAVAAGAAFLALTACSNTSAAGPTSPAETGSQPGVTAPQKPGPVTETSPAVNSVEPSANPNTEPSAQTPEVAVTAENWQELARAAASAKGWLFVTDGGGILTFGDNGSGALSIDFPDGRVQWYMFDENGVEGSQVGYGVETIPQAPDWR